MGTKRQAGMCMAAILLGLLLLLDTALATGAVNVLTGVTTGQQKISGKNIPGAKKKAVKEALEAAVQNAFATLVSRQVFGATITLFNLFTIDILQAIRRFKRYNGISKRSIGLFIN